MMAPLGFAGALIDAAEGSAYYGEPGTTEYYKLVAVFDSGEESKPATIGPIVTDGDGGTLTRKRVHLTWDAYPTTAQTSPSGASVTPTAMRVYRSALSDFSVSQKMDRELYPVPEEPGDFRCTGSSGSGTDYIYRVYQYYYLSGRSPDGTEITVNSGALPDDVDVSLAWIADPAVDQVNRGTPDTYADGVMVAQVFGRDDSDGHGGPGRYLSVGLYGSYHDDGRDTQKGGGGIEPFPAAPTGVDIPVTGTSLYDQWPGKQDVADNPWVTV